MSDRLKKIIRYLLMSIGIAMFTGLVYQLGIGQIMEQVDQFGWWFLSISLISLCWFISITMSWRVILLSFGFDISFRKLLGLKLMAEGTNIVAPSANLGGEALRIFYLKQMTGSEIATGSVILDKTMDNLAKMVFMTVGVTVSVYFIPVPDQWFIISITFLIAVLIFNLLTILFQLGGVFGKGASILERISFFKERIEKYRQKLHDIDGHLKKSYSENRLRLIQAAGWHFVRRLLNVSEVWLILWVLTGESNPLISVSVMSLTTIVNNVFFLIPGQWGVAEGAQALLTELAGLTMATGISLGVIRRIRLLLFTGIGLVILQRLKKH